VVFLTGECLLPCYEKLDFGAFPIQTLCDTCFLCRSSDRSPLAPHACFRKRDVTPPTCFSFFRLPFSPAFFGVWCWYRLSERFFLFSLRPNPPLVQLPACAFLVATPPSHHRQLGHHVSGPSGFARGSGFLRVFPTRSVQRMMSSSQCLGSRSFFSGILLALCCCSLLVIDSFSPRSSRFFQRREAPFNP